MKGLVLAAVAFVVLIALSTVFLRLYRGRKHFRALLAAFGAALGVYGVLYRALPPDLGFLPGVLLEPHGGMDFANGVLVLALLFHGFWDTAYATAITGLSTNVIVLIGRAGGLATSDLLRLHHADREVDAVLAWRLRNLVQGGYVVLVDGAYRLRTKGRIVGAAARSVKILLTGTDAGG